jgi:hypothetical protein
MLTQTILLTALAACAIALPTSNHLRLRAGGPAIKPIPSTCNVTNPLPITDCDSTFLPGPSTNDAVLYYAYYDSLSTNTTSLAEQCLQQCYGFGDSTQCKAAFWAENMVVPAGYYGSPGGNLETACLMFNRALTSADFAAAPEGQATSPYAGNIKC